METLLFENHFHSFTVSYTELVWFPPLRIERKGLVTLRIRICSLRPKSVDPMKLLEI